MVLLTRLAFFWKMLRHDGRMMWQLVKHPATPGWLKIAAVLPIVYIFSPLDFFPDAIPLLGVLDDALVVGLIPKFWQFLASKAPLAAQTDAKAQVDGVIDQ